MVLLETAESACNTNTASDDPRLPRGTEGALLLIQLMKRNASALGDSGGASEDLSAPGTWEMFCVCTLGRGALERGHAASDDFHSPNSMCL